MIVAGRVVCTSCMESQALEDCEIPFSHSLECEARDDKFKNPWVALHDVLDCARGRPQLMLRSGLVLKRSSG